MPTLEEFYEQRELFEKLGKDAPRKAARPPNSYTLTTGETCRTCVHSGYVQYASRFYKCGLNRANWTNGKGTDIRLKDAACNFYEAEKKEK